MLSGSKDQTMNFINMLLSRKKTLKKYKKGISFYNKKKFAEAIEQFESMLAEKSLSKSFEYNLAKFYCSQAHRDIGIIQFARGENDQAVINFQAAFKHNPNHPDLNYFIGICLNNIGKFQEAIESFDKLQKIDRKSTRLNSSHANISYAVFCLKKNQSTPMSIFILGFPS